MSSVVATFSDLLALACGRTLDEGSETKARRMQLVVFAFLASLVFAAAWGAAAGSRDLGLVVGNLVKVPMVVLLSALSALPAGLLTLKLSGVKYRSSDLLVGYSASVWSGTLVLLVLAPLVAVYYHTSSWAGPALGMGSVFIALGAATLVFARAVFGRRPDGVRKRALVPTVLVLVALKIAMLVQMIALASPILPEVTPFDGGVDELFDRAAR